jgi:hypothetical protein
MNLFVLSRRYRTAAALLAVVILLVPPLVRASAHLRRPSDGPITFRLNRGFDLPETKSTVAPPVDGRFELVTSLRISIPPEQRHVAVQCEQSCLDQHRQSPDPLRGPPSTLSL